MPNCYTSCTRARLGDISFCYSTRDGGDLVSITQEVTSMIGVFEPLKQIVRRRKLQWFGHVSRHTDSLANTIMQGSLWGKQTRGRPKTSWIDNIHSWTGLNHEHCLRNCWNRNNWQTILHAANTPLAMGMNGHWLWEWTELNSTSTQGQLGQFNPLTSKHKTYADFDRTAWQST